MGALTIVALICALGYYISLTIWPNTYCRGCKGGGRNTGSTRKRFGTCRRCQGSGRKPRLGNRVRGRL